MPQFQINYTAQLDADSVEAAQPVADAGAKALSDAGATVSGISVIPLVMPIKVQVVDMKTKTIREETVLANDEEEAKTLLGLTTDEFIPTKEAAVEPAPIPTPTEPAPTPTPVTKPPTTTTTVTKGGS